MPMDLKPAGVRQTRSCLKTTHVCCQLQRIVGRSTPQACIAAELRVGISFGLTGSSSLWGASVAIRSPRREWNSRFALHNERTTHGMQLAARRSEKTTHGDWRGGSIWMLASSVIDRKSVV